MLKWGMPNPRGGPKAGADAAGVGARGGVTKVKWGNIGSGGTEKLGSGDGDEGNLRRWMGVGRQTAWRWAAWRAGRWWWVWRW